jgi:hypothetical protein
MFEVLAIVALSAVIVALVAVIIVSRRPKSWLDRVTGERVLVHTVDSQTIEGSLFAVLSDGVLLKAPRLMEDQPLNIAGEVFIPRAKIAMVQRPGSGDA